MDVVLFVDILSKSLIAMCALLAAVAVIFLVVRPWIDPHWKDGRASPAETLPGEGLPDRETGGMQGT